MPMFIIVKVKRKPLPGFLNSYLEQCGPYSSSREWNEHNFLYPLTKQRWGCSIVQLPGHSTEIHVTTSCSCHCKLECSKVWGACFLTHDSSGSRYPTKMLVYPCVSVMSITMVLRNAWSCCHFFKENHKCGRKQLPGLWGLSWWGVADRLRTSQGKK